VSEQGLWDRLRTAAAGLGEMIVQGLALAGHGQWGFPWSPVDPDLEPGPGELSWAEFEAELHSLLTEAGGETHPS